MCLDRLGLGKSRSFSGEQSGGKNYFWLTIFLFVSFLLQIISFGYFFAFLIDKGYLPSPFVDDKFDTFMDLYHTIWWSDNDGRYTVWGSVYPPINFLFLKIMSALAFPLGSRGNSFDLRAENITPGILIFALHFIGPFWVVFQREWAYFRFSQRALMAGIAAISPIFLFSAERGNLIILSLFFLPWLLSEEQENAHPWLLAVLINLKPYFALLLLAYIFRGDWRRFLQAMALSGAVFIITGLMLDSNFPLFLTNILNFAGNEAVFSGRAVLALPASLSAFSYAIGIYMKGSAAPGLYESVLAAMPSLIETAKLIFLLLALWGLYVGRSRIKVTESFCLLIFLAVNMGVWAGGYSQIFYFATVPVLIRTERRKIILALIGFIFFPLDLITLYEAPPVSGFSFFSEIGFFSSLNRIEVIWQLGLGSVARPVLNSILIVVFSSLLIRRSQLNVSKESPNNV